MKTTAGNFPKHLSCFDVTSLKLNVYDYENHNHSFNNNFTYYAPKRTGKAITHHGFYG